MRICHVFVLLVAWIGEAKGASDLQIVYDELATITRITNAIALQAAVIRKSIKVRDVVVELLKVDQKNFTDLMNYKPEILSSATEGLFKETGKAKDIDLKSFKPGKDWLEGIRGALEHTINEDLTSKQLMVDIRLAFQLKAFENGLRLDSSLKDVAEFGRALKANDTVIVTDFQVTKNALISQLKIEHFTTMSNFKFVDLNSKSLTELESMISITKPFINSVKPPVTPFLENFETAFDTTQGIWSNQNQKTGTLFTDAVQKLTSMFSVSIRHELTLTPGFPEHGDMAKVAKDLDSNWFLEKVARGQSVEALREGLKGFFKFGDLMSNLEDRWTTFGGGFLSLKRDAFVVAALIGKIEKYKDGPNGKKALQNAKNAWDTCSKIAEGIAEYEDISEDLKLIQRFLTAGSKVVERAKLIKKDWNEESMKKILDHLQKSTDLETFQKAKTEIPDGYENMILVLGHVIELEQAQADLINLSNDVKKRIDLISISISISNTVDSHNNLISYLKCLKEASLDPTKLIHMISFIHNVHTLSNATVHERIHMMLNEFVSMRKQVLDMESFVKGIGPTSQKEHLDDKNNPILKLEHSQDMVLSLGRGMYVLRDMTRALAWKQTLIVSTEFPESFNLRIQQYVKNSYIQKFWAERVTRINNLIEELEKLNKFASTIKDKGLLTMRKILDEGLKVQGFPEVFPSIRDQFMKNEKGIEDEIQVLKNLSVLDLDFASHKGYLHAASLSFDELRIYCDEIFGLNKKPNHVVEHNYLTATLVCVSILLLLIIGALLFSGLTKSGRNRFRKLYFFYFGKPEEFEKRWRYSLFLDRQDGKNALLDAAREINATNVLKAAKKGAYINAYNQYGNTALHVATKRGYPEIVEILIKNGADRNLLNSRNKTPEQLIPANWRSTQTTQQTEIPTERFEDVEKIYKKYRNKKYRIRVPEVFPSSSFHIYIEDRADETLTNEFMKKFQAITSNEPLPTTTHYIVKTDQDGVLDLESMELLVWILSGVIIVKETWMTDCLKDEKLIEKDSMYLVEKVRYKGTVYDTVIQWSESMAKSMIPYLCGVYVGVTIPDYPNIVPLSALVVNNGGVMCSKFPEKSMFNTGSHPYLHAHLGPIFLIHDGKTDLQIYKNDADKMYTLFTEDEFVAFLLKRGINLDTNPDPIPATTELDD